MAADPYAELGVPVESDAAEIRAAYLRLMREHHPDHHGCTERASRLNAAYDVLGHPARRAAHARRSGLRHVPLAVTPPARELRTAYSQQRAAFQRSFSTATVHLATILLVLGTLLLLAFAGQ